MTNDLDLTDGILALIMIRSGRVLEVIQSDRDDACTDDDIDDDTDDVTEDDDTDDGSDDQTIRQ